jgi:hypothetical protein
MPIAFWNPHTYDSHGIQLCNWNIVCSLCRRIWIINITYIRIYTRIYMDFKLQRFTSVPFSAEGTTNSESKRHCCFGLLPNWSLYHVSPSLLMVNYEMKSTFRQHRSNVSCTKASYSSKLHFWRFWNVYSGNGSLVLWSSVSCVRSASGSTISLGTMDFISVSTSREQLLPCLFIALFYLIF